MYDRHEARPRPRLAAGWRILLTMIAMFSPAAAGIAVSLVLPATSGLMVELFATAMMALGGIGAVYLLWRFIDRAPRGSIAWRPTKWTPLLWLGGLLAAGVTIGLAKVLGVALGLDSWPEDGYNTTGFTIGILLFAIVSIMLSQGLPEELVWRGYLFGSLRDRWPRWATLVTVSAGFGVLHVISNPGETAPIGYRLLYALMACGMGFALASCREVSGGIWLGVGFHTGHNLFTGLLGSGAYNLSLLVNFAMLCAFGALLLVVRRRRAPSTGQPVGGGPSLPGEKKSDRVG